jgi:hypothetical protein
VVDNGSIYYPTIVIHTGGALQRRDKIAVRMTGDTPTFYPVVKENTSNFYTPMKNSIRSAAFVAETGDDRLTCAIHLNPGREIYPKSTRQSLQQPFSDIYTP